MILLILFLVIDDSNEEADRTITENETRKLIQKYGYQFTINKKQKVYRLYFYI